MRSTVRLGIFIVTSLVLVAAIVLSLQAPELRGHLGVLPSLLSNPLSVAIASAVMIFLVVERWRNLESEISKLRDDQNQTLRDIKSDSENLVKSKMDQVTNRAQAIEGKISDLVDKNPWITDISEMEIIPDSPLCRVVLATAEELLVTKTPLLCYEYLSSVLRKDSKIALEGVSVDFLDLAWFCETGLRDSYLAYRAIAKGIDCWAAYSELTPYYLRLAVRHGDYATASRIAGTISRQLNPRGIVRSLIVQQVNSGGIVKYLPMFVIERSRRRDAEVAALASLAVFEDAYGRKDRAVKYLRKAADQPARLSTEEAILLQIVAIESMLLLGERQAAVTAAALLSIDASLSSTLLMEIFSVLRQADLKDAAARTGEILRARLRRHLLDKGQLRDEGLGPGLAGAGAPVSPNGNAGPELAYLEPRQQRHSADGLIAPAVAGFPANSHERPAASGDTKDL